ncbi:MAG: MBL fold metallo-hydrolase [Frankiaceae bacterium]|nr:MBL fold metallo-hydrolase [Frankiaceae bacterium]
MAKRFVLLLLTLGLLAVPVPASAETRGPIASFAPLPANPTVTPAAKAARDKLLGDRWDDPGYVTLHWIGVSSMVVTIRGHLLLFDAWQIIGAVDDYLPLTRDDLAALDPEAILVGHGHFDHAGDLGFVAGKSGAVVVGSEEICTVAVEGATREGVGTAFRCAITGTMTSPAMGVTQRLKLFADLPAVSVLQHIHSAATPPGNGNDPDPFFPIMDAQPYIDHFATDPEELARFLAQQQESNQGGTWLYHFVDGDFTLLIGDSAGPIFDQPAIRTALGRFPGCVDVMANAILGFDQPVSGLADPVDYIDAAKPSLFLPTHADAWAPVLSAGQAQYKDKLTSELAELKNPPAVDFLLDPQDYLKQRAYRVADSRWKTPPAGSVCAAAAAAPSPVPGPSTPSAGPAGGGLPSTGGVPAYLAVLVLAAGLLLRRRLAHR